MVNTISSYLSTIYSFYITTRVVSYVAHVWMNQEKTIFTKAIILPCSKIIIKIKFFVTF
jgi:hypothetical protein